MIEIFPIKFEAYNEFGQLFKVEQFDEQSAKIEITEVVSASEWPEISAKIHDCLKQMKYGNTDKLIDAARKTLLDNPHLDDGDQCTLLDLKKSVMLIDPDFEI